MKDTDGCGGGISTITLNERGNKYMRLFKHTSKHNTAGRKPAGNEENGKQYRTINVVGREIALSPKNIVKAVLLCFLVLFLALVIYSVFAIATAPKIDTAKIYETLSENSTIYDASGKKVDSVYSGENRTNARYNDMPDNLINAYIALEDKTFKTHHGFNFIRILGAIKESVFGGGKVGGTSTITQQLARNVYLKTRMSERSLNRKVVEAWYTLKLENNLSKKQIIEAYLNTIYLGFNSWGVESASEAYFQKRPKDLSLEQCAALAALPQSPTNLALVNLLDKDAKPKPSSILKRTSSGIYVINDISKERRETCLKLMLEQKYITRAQYEKAVKVPLRSMLKPNYHMNDSTIAYFTDYTVAKVIKDLQKKEKLSYDEAWDKVYKGGLKIYSTMDKKAQKTIQKEFKNNGNFPSITNINYDSNNNILNKYGKVALYSLGNYIKNGRFTFKSNEIKDNSDGSVTIKANKRLKIYNTSVNGKTDYSLEFPAMYKWKDGKLNSISGGYINIPQQYKQRDDNGNVIVSSRFMQSKEGKQTFQKVGGKYSIPKSSYSINQGVVQPQAAMTIVENSTGEIKAMVGGRKTKGKLLYNRAVEPRQPGSSIKPLGVYAPALQQGAEEAAAGKTHNFVNYNIDRQGAQGWGNHITAGSVVMDERTTNNGRVWPYNAGSGYSGRNTLRSAIRNSINTCAYKIWMQVGQQYSTKMVKKFGISTVVTKGRVNDNNAAALALGGMSKGVTTLEMANAYTTFPNNGVRAEEPICYTKVVDADGKTLLTKSSRSTRVLNSDVAWIMADLMKGVVSGGTGTAANVYGTRAGGKTGTTSNQYDIWFDGFTPKYSAALWIGNDINISLTSMSGYAAALWGKIMNQIPSAKTGSYKAQPHSVQYIGGEYYAKGTYSYSNYVSPEEILRRKQEEEKKRQEKDKPKMGANSSGNKAKKPN